MINKFHTTCKGCVFAEYEDKTQVGCQLDLLDNYEEVLEAYDDEQEFFVINKQICLKKRSEEWGRRFPPNQWSDQVYKELAIKWHPIIFFTNSADLIKSLDSIKKQKIAPTHVTVICPANSTVPAHKITKWLKGLGSWRVQGMEVDDIERLDQVDLVLDKYKFPFYMVFDAGFTLKDNLLEQIDALINKNMKFFGMIVNEDKSLYIVPTIVHEMFGGSSFGIPLEEKIANKCPEKILKYENLIE